MLSASGNYRTDHTENTDLHRFFLTKLNRIYPNFASWGANRFFPIQTEFYPQADNGLGFSLREKFLENLI